MKSFFRFLKEAKKSQAADQAERLNLTGDGHGNWYDKDGDRVAVTKKGRLEMLSKKEKQETDESPKQETKSSEGQQSVRQMPVQQGEFGAFADGSPRRMPPPTTADGSPKEDLGPLTVTFGRFNPPTIGHQKLLDAAKKAAGKGSLKVYPSRSQDAKKNPYDPDEKVDVMRQMFPDHAENIVNDPNARTIFDVLKQAHQDGYSSIKIVVGGDRVKEFEKLSGDYNGQLYDFSGVETVSAGERDPDSKDVDGMSASKMRKAAADNDFKTFRQGVPKSIDDKSAKQMMNTLRKKMNVKEGWNLWEIAPKFDWKNLRESYVSGKIFKVDQLVENLNTGLIGKVLRRGTNYLICVTEDNIMFKSWIKDLREYTEVKMNSKTRVKGKPNTLIGTAGYFKYAADMTPGFDKGEKTNLQTGGKPYKGYGREFINKYRKKK
tara:strand:- start:3058 stop:4356 length:1299 start_codon:yes stop_codon:yes gene_type:complete